MIQDESDAEQFVQCEWLKTLKKWSMGGGDQIVLEKETL